MRRKIYQDLLNWKRNRNGDVALLIEGARRIGKSYIVEEFARREYDSYLLVDFSKVSPQVIEFFNLYLDDLDTLFMSLEVFFRRKLTPRNEAHEEAKSLIIFDEVQFCPRARAAIKHLVADRRYDYIETGSLISIKKNVKDIMIPSEEHSIEMYPMDFEEFLWANGDEMMMPFIQQQFNNRKPMGTFHRKAMDYFRQYLIVGGMPQAVAKYVETHDFERVDEVKRDILALYRNDINKYAEGQEMKVTSIFDEIPGQLQKHEKKFRLFALQDNARIEIDFLIAKDKTTSRHNISPIEVKSGKSYTLTSLKKCIAKYNNHLATPYVLHDKDLKEEDGILYLPLYMTPLL